MGYEETVRLCLYVRESERVQERKKCYVPRKEFSRTLLPRVFVRGRWPDGYGAQMLSKIGEGGMKKDGWQESQGILFQVS